MRYVAEDVCKYFGIYMQNALIITWNILQFDIRNLCRYNDCVSDNGSFNRIWRCMYDQEMQCAGQDRLGKERGKSYV